MRVFAYEYLCGSGRAGSSRAAPSLLAEGWAMLNAVVDDLCRLPRLEVVTRLSPEWSKRRDWPKNFKSYPADEASEADDLRRLARASDCTLLIAPETGDLLGQRAQWIEECGAKLLGPSAAAIRLTADKLRLAEHLAKRGVPTPRTVPWSAEAGSLGFPLVVKPRDGAGSQAIFLVRDLDELRQCPARARSEGCDSELVMQPFVPGMPASVSFAIGPGGKLCLKPARQNLSNDGRFHYLGGSIPLPDDKVAKALAVRVLPLIPGLRGWFGIDVVLQGDHGQIIEINPRLTTSYLGLRRLAKFNLMDLLLGAASNDSLPMIDWRDEPIDFSAEG